MSIIHRKVQVTVGIFKLDQFFLKTEPGGVFFIFSFLLKQSGRFFIMCILIIITECTVDFERQFPAQRSGQSESLVTVFVIFCIFTRQACACRNPYPFIKSVNLALQPNVGRIPCGLIKKVLFFILKACRADELLFPFGFQRNRHTVAF